MFNIRVTCSVISTVFLVYVSGSASDEFDTLVSTYWDWRLSDAPEFATSVDVHTYDQRVEQYTLVALEERQRKVTHFHKQLKEIDRSKLESGKQISYDILEDTLEVFLDGYKWRYYGPMNPVNFLEGMWTDVDYYIPSRLQTYDDFNAYTLRIYGWGDQALNFVVRMELAKQHNTTNHWVSMTAVPDELDELIGSSEVDCPLYAPFNETLDNTTISDTDKTALRTSAISVIKTFREKHQALKRYILEIYQNFTRSEFGVSSLPDGKVYYRACLRWHLSIDKTPEEIHQTGLQEVDRISTQMQKVIKRLKFTGTIQQFYQSLNNNDSFLINSSADTIKAFEEIIYHRIQPQLSKFFKDIPNNPVIVKEMPFDGPGGSYSSGSSDGIRPGIFYANVRRPGDNPTYSMPALALHETDPGHHLQDIYAQAAVDVAAFQKTADYTKYFSVPYHFPFYTAYSEGWGLYAESLGEEDYLNVFKDDYELMGRYSLEIFRACRLVVDTGLHSFNWDRQDAIDYLLNYTSLSTDSATIEIDRYITWPAQATAYKTGELHIKQLRQQAKDELGPLFDIKDFHSVVLNTGPVPLSLLTKLVEAWINTVKTSDSFAKISTEFWDWRMRSSREYSSSIGNYKYNDKLDSFTYDKLEEQKVTADGFKLRLSWIHRNELPNNMKIPFDVLKNTIDTFIEGYEWKDYGPLNPINFLELWFVGLEYFVSGDTFNTEGDFVNYVRRIERIPQQLQEMVELSKLAIQKGTTSHNVSVSRVPENIDSFVVENATDSEFWKPYNEHADRIYGDIKDGIKKRLTNAIDAANNKFKDVQKFVIEDYMPHTRPGLGVGSLPNGTQNYEACLYYHTSTRMTAEEIHNTGLSEVARIAEQMRQKMENVGFPKDTTISEMYQNLTYDPRFLLPNKADILSTFNKIIYERIEPEISKYFVNIPNLPLEVRGSPSDGIGGEYWAGTADGSRPGIFYVNLHKPEYNPTYKMVSLSLHEAIPGHHLADSYGLLADIPAFMKNYEWLSYNAPYFWPFYNSFVEGWGLYSEYLGEEMGIYRNDYEMLGRYSDEMLRAVRLVVDTGIHHYNWTRQRAIDYMLNYTAETTSSAAIEIDRYATWPGQACGYKIGEIFIKQQRKKAETALGDKFHIGEFHYAMLRNSALPLEVLEAVIDDWISSVKRDTTQQPCPNIVTSSANSIIKLAVSIFTFWITILVLFV